MKIKSLRRAIKTSLFVFVAAASFGVAATANAQSSAQHAVAIRFTLPFEVYWGAKVLPAGQYTMYFDNSHPASLVESASGKTTFFTPIPIKNHSDKGPAGLLVMIRGNQRMIRSLNLPKSDLSLVYQPATSAEREILAKAEQVEAVPLTSAR